MLQAQFERELHLWQTHHEFAKKSSKIVPLGSPFCPASTYAAFAIVTFNNDLCVDLASCIAPSLFRHNCPSPSLRPLTQAYRLILSRSSKRATRLTTRPNGQSKHGSG